MDGLPFALQTERLRLRPWTLGDALAVFGYASDPRFGRFLPLPDPYSILDAEQFCERCVASDWDIHQQFAIEFEGFVVGDVNLRIDRSAGTGTIGYGISADYWGRGIVTEAATALVGHAFGALNLQKIVATADAENIASWRVMERLGMQREGYFRSHRVLRGERRDVVQYGLLATDSRPA